MNWKEGRIDWGRFILRESNIAVIIAAALFVGLQLHGRKATLVELQLAIFVLLSGINVWSCRKKGPSEGSNAPGAHP
jgi:hypothetical protein